MKQGPDLTMKNKFGREPYIQFVYGSGIYLFVDYQLPVCVVTGLHDTWCVVIPQMTLLLKDSPVLTQSARSLGKDQFTFGRDKRLAELLVLCRENILMGSSWFILTRLNYLIAWKWIKCLRNSYSQFKRSLKCLQAGSTFSVNFSCVNTRFFKRVSTCIVYPCCTPIERSSLYFNSQPVYSKT